MNIWIVHNPAAGPYDVGPALNWVAERLGERGAQVELIVTREPGEIAGAARRAIERGVDFVLSSGGDGTLSALAMALAGSGVACGVLPAGTANVWARQVGLPVAPLLPGNDSREVLLQAALAQLDGRPRPVDMGRTGASSFLLWAGAGLDAFVTHAVEPRPRSQKRLGMLGYALAAIILGAQYQGMHAEVAVDGTRLKGRMLLVVVSNTKLYLGGLVKIDPDARVDDGLLDVWVFYGLGPGWTARQMAGLFTGRHLRDPNVRHLRGRHVSVTTREPAAVHVDGEPCGNTPLAVDVVPGAALLLVPASAPEDLFTKEGER